MLKLTVVSIKEETSKIKIFKLAYDQNFTFKPGQWIDLRVPIEGKNIGGYTIISSPDQDGYIELAVRSSLNHPVTKYLHQNLKVGDTLWSSKAQGRFLLADEILNSPIVFIAGGIGITPILSMIRTLASKKSSFKLFYSVSYREDIVLQEELSPFANIIMTKEGDPRISVQTLKENGVDFNLQPHFFICGPKGMIDSLNIELKNSGVPDKNIHFEKWW